jgi:F-type H+-transporting ATPase subunit epsilon
MSRSVPSRLALKIITSQRLLVDAEVDAVRLPGLDGEIGVLPGHRPLVTVLGQGELTYRLEGRDESLAVGGGHAEIRPESVLVFTELVGDDEDES